MALLSAVSLPANSGVNVTVNDAASAGGDTAIWKPGSRAFLLILNGDASPMTLTVTAQNAAKTVDGDNYAVASIAQAIAAGEYRVLPITEAFADATNTVSLSYSAVANVTVRLVEMNF